MNDFIRKLAKNIRNGILTREQAEAIVLERYGPEWVEKLAEHLKN